MGRAGRNTQKGGDPLELSWARVAPAVEALPADEVLDPRLDFAKVVEVAVRAERFWQTPAVRARFERLPADAFDHAVLDALPDLTRALLHAHRQHLMAAAQATAAKVPTALATEARALRERMLQVVTYVLGDEPSVQEEVASIRGGHGYLDLAMDLMRCATLYGSYASQLRRDRVHYRPADGDRAEALSERLMVAGAPPDVRERGLVVRRAYTLFHRAWTELCAAGQFLYRGEPKALSVFVSLHTAARTPPRKRKPPTP